MINFDFILGNQPRAESIFPDPIASYGRALTLAELSRRQRQGVEEDAAKSEAREAQRVAAQTFADAQTMGWQAAIQKAAQMNPQGAALALRLRKEEEGAEAEREYKRSQTIKNKADAGKTSVEARVKAAQDIGNVAYQEAEAPNKLSLSRVQFVAKAHGIELPPLAEGDDVQSYLKSLAAQAFDVKDRVTADLTRSRDAETGRHNKTTESLTAARDAQHASDSAANRGVQMTVAKMTDARARETNQVTRDATSGAKINAETQAYSKMIDSTALPNLITSANALNDTIKSYAGQKIPGVGVPQSYMPPLLLSRDGKKVRSQIQAVANDLLKLYSGGAVTANEAERRATEMMASGQFNDDDLREAWPLVVGRINAAQQNARAGFSPEAVETYESRGGLRLRPIDATGKPKLGMGTPDNGDWSVRKLPGGR